MNGYSVLVIDDEHGIRSGACELLRLEGYEAVEAATGREALDALERRPFDVALIDYRLPDIDGLTLLAALKARRPDTMTCMITAYANIETAIAATTRGIDFFLPKPFSAEDLLGVLDTLMRHRKVREEAARLRREHEASLLALATEKSQTRSLVACLRDAVLVVNRDGEVALANRAMAELLGEPEAALLRRPAAEVLAGPEFAPVRERLASGRDDAASIALEREERALVAAVTPFRSDEGEALGHVATFSDITEVRRLAMEKARFIRTMVHEFRSPLGAVRALLEVVQDRSLGDAVEPYLPMLGRAQKRIDGLTELIGNLLSLSQIEVSGGAGPAEPCDAAAVAAEVAEAHRERAAAASVAIVVEGAQAPRAAIAADDLRTVLVNLVGNGIKYNRPGGSVRVSVAPAAGGVRLEVADTGIGLKAESLPRLFEEFFREKRRETRGIEGNGLGLAIVKRLVERAGGRVAVASREGEGTSFVVDLPPAA